MRGQFLLQQRLREEFQKKLLRVSLTPENERRALRSFPSRHKQDSKGDEFWLRDGSIATGVVVGEEVLLAAHTLHLVQAVGLTYAVLPFLYQVDLLLLEMIEHLHMVAGEEQLRMLLVNLRIGKQGKDRRDQVWMQVRLHLIDHSNIAGC